MQMMKLSVKGILTKVLLSAAMMMPAILAASTSEKPDGSKVRYFDIVIAYEGVDGGENSVVRSTFRKVLEHFAYGIYQSTQGRHKLRKVVVFSNKEGESHNRFVQFMSSCDIRWYAGSQWPEAPCGRDVCGGTSLGECIIFSDAPKAKHDDVLPDFDLSNAEDQFLVKYDLTKIE